MSYAVCWLDTHEAKVFEFKPAKVEKTDLKIKREDHDAEHFYHRVAEELKSKGEVLIVGPGVAKTQFMHHLENHKHNDIKKKVVGVESCDHPTDKQILAIARKFFKQLDVFEAI